MEFVPFPFLTHLALKGHGTHDPEFLTVGGIRYFNQKNLVVHSDGYH